MYEFRYLLDRFWVTRADNKELYFTVKRALPSYRRFVNEQLGWNLIVNESVIKLEKVPPKAMTWMGIQEFQEKLDYCLLCGMLLFLSDLDDGEQFLLSSLTESLEALLREVQPVDWTRFPHRKALVRVLQYAQRIGMILVYDGVSEGFGNDQTQEVLYENTGVSRCFTVHFGRDIMQCRTVEDFEAFSWEGEEAERGRQRIRRVYRQLILAPALYWSEQNRSDYDYVKNQRSWLNRYLGEALGGELQIHKNGAFFVLDEENRFGPVHPRDASIPDAVLLLCAQLRDQIVAGVYPREEDDTVFLTRRELQNELAQCRMQYGNGWGRRVRELPMEKLAQELIAYMAGWMLLEERGEGFALYPAVGKWIGHYPVRYQGGSDEEDVDEPLENA
nr:TIGR02678 family protein [uncultured Agathobaculum sp.]